MGPDEPIDWKACDEKTVTAARDLYNAYIANSGGKAWDGRPCPTWESMAETEAGNRVRSHWCAVVIAARALAAGGCL